MCEPPKYEAIIWLLTLDEHLFIQVAHILASFVEEGMCPSCAINKVYEDKDGPLAEALFMFNVPGSNSVH